MKQKPMDTAEISMIMSLPAELKLKILGFLPGLEIAKVGCLCSELRNLSSADDLWKQKFEEEFGQGTAEDGMKGFKDLFAQYWKRKNNSAQSVHVTSLHCLTCFSTTRDFNFNPLSPSSNFRRDFDSLPGFGVSPIFRSPDPPRSRFHSPQVFLPTPDPPYINFQL